ncbi:MAG TPA: low affinity iron permease family protein [Opitutaceae bacterium]|nr:low affinity iron permease family protein [Opitutaceae bacterium]
MTNTSPPPKRPPFFNRFARGTAHAAGRPATFLIVLVALVAWGASGPVFHYSNAWQLIINTTTNVITFLMVFLIQATQNRDSQALHVKLDELIRAVHGARNSLLNLDDLSDEELEQLHDHFVSLAARARKVTDR